MDEFDLPRLSKRAEAVRKDLAAYKTEGGVFNLETLGNVGKLGSEGAIDRILGPIATGKEADVFLAERGDKKAVVKIFRLTTSSYFKNPSVLQYILGDERFKKLKKDPKSLVFAWSQKEFRNLKKAEELKIRAPRAIAWEKNVLVMDFIGGEEPAPRLLKYGMGDAKATFKDIVGQMRRMYKGKFVHADMSEYNILMHDEKPYIIDFSQGVLLSHPRALEFLERDVKNICNFFMKRGLEVDFEKTLKRING
jgi:RIO kinase 1